MLFFGWAIYFYYHSVFVSIVKLLPDAASVHGAYIDKLEKVSFIIISIAYLLVQPLLWLFAFQYRYKEGKKAWCQIITACCTCVVRNHNQLEVQNIIIFLKYFIYPALRVFQFCIKI
jgi:hypothetical protein